VRKAFVAADKKVHKKAISDNTSQSVRVASARCTKSRNTCKSFKMRSVMMETAIW